MFDAILCLKDRAECYTFFEDVCTVNELFSLSQRFEVAKMLREAEAYSAVWDLMIQIEKELPMAYVFYGQDSLVENDKRYDEIGIFLRSSHFLKNLEKHVQKAEAIIYGR